MGNRQIMGLDGKMVTVDENGMYVNTTDYDWSYGVTTDRGEIDAAAKNARMMIQILKTGAGKGGFDESAILQLLDAFIVVGQWTRGSGYARPISLHFTFHRAPRVLPPGQKFSALLLHWTTQFVSAWDPKDRRRAFDEMQTVTLEVVWSFHRALLESDKTRAVGFEQKLRALVSQDYRTAYRFRW